MRVLGLRAGAVCLRSGAGVAAGVAPRALSGSGRSAPSPEHAFVEVNSVPRSVDLRGEVHCEVRAYQRAATAVALGAGDAPFGRNCRRERRDFRSWLSRWAAAAHDLASWKSRSTCRRPSGPAPRAWPRADRSTCRGANVLFRARSYARRSRSPPARMKPTPHYAPMLLEDDVEHAIVQEVSHHKHVVVRGTWGVSQRQGRVAPGEIVDTRHGRSTWGVA